jgi:hypothetical protein
MRDKSFLHIINEMVSIIGPLKDFLYIYKWREIITLYMNGLYNYYRSRIP